MGGMEQPNMPQYAGEPAASGPVRRRFEVKGGSLWVNMKEEEIESFAVSVEKTQQRLLNQSYVKFSIEEMMEIYRALY